MITAIAAALTGNPIYFQRLKKPKYLAQRRIKGIFQGLCIFAACSLVGIPAKAMAQVTPDGTLPTSVEQLREIMKINGGQRAGNNLFHSFEEFSIPEGIEAVFENATDIENIFTRITGESVSNIEGILKTQGGANFFLINPNGIIFGENAQLDVGGSFIATTADSIQFEGGTEFAANDSTTEPIITIDRPIGLGFGSNPGAINVNGTGNQIASDSAFSPIDLGNTEKGLSVTPGKTLALIGGEINFSGGIITTEGGKIEISSLKSGSVRLQETENGLTFNYNDAFSYQNITLADQALLNTSGTGKGAISLTGNNVSLSNGSFVLDQNRGNIDSGDISINAFESLNLSRTSSIRSESLSSGRASKIDISTRKLFVINNASIAARTLSEAFGSDLTIYASDSVDIDNSNISTLTFADGNAGNLKLETSHFQANNAGVFTSSTAGTGNSGNVNVKAQSIEIAGGLSLSRSNISASSFNTGNAGNLNIDTEQLKIQNGGSVSSSAAAEGDAGSVVVNASKSV
jgi:filamentous hemagglutinin family protein